MKNDALEVLERDLAFSDEELKQAKLVAEQVRSYVKENPHGLKTYTDAVAIDGLGTADRDDAFNITEDENYVYVDVFVANPSKFILKDTPLYNGAKNRFNTFYSSVIKPMLPRELTSVFSLDEGKKTPAIKISLKISKKSGKIEEIGYEQCFVQPKNMIYEEVATLIASGDKKYSRFSEVAAWLRKSRQHGSSSTVLPDYDAANEVMTLPEGERVYVPKAQVSAFNLVSEVMISANHAMALIQKHCYESQAPQGIFRIQSNSNGSATFSGVADKHASLGLIYMWGTSPIRRFADWVMHDILANIANGRNSFTINLQERGRAKLNPPELPKKLLDLIGELNEKSKFAKYARKVIARTKDYVLWGKVYAKTDEEKLKQANQMQFSSMLRGACEKGELNELFLNELFLRIDGKGGVTGTYSLDYQQDVVNLFRFSDAHRGENYEQWMEIKSKVMARLRSYDTAQIKTIFEEFAKKIDAKESYLVTASFFTRQGAKATTNKFELSACAYVVKIGKEWNTTEEFAIGFREKSAEIRAMQEFMLAYAEGRLKKSSNPSLPKEDAVYIARNIMRENAERRKESLLEKGFDIRESLKAFESGRGYLSHIEITHKDMQPISVYVRREVAADATLIALETAIGVLRKREIIDNNESSQSGITTFVGRVEKSREIAVDSSQTIGVGKVEVVDMQDYPKLVEAIGSEGVRIEKINGKSIISFSDIENEQDRFAKIREVSELMVSVFHNLIPVTEGDNIIIRDTPKKLASLLATLERGDISR